MNLIDKLFRKKYDKTIALDVELDGMHPSHIIQLSYLVIEGRRIRGKNFFFSAKAINRYARQVHGISVYQLKKLSGGKGFIDYADEIYRDFIDCKLIIGHDVAGDIRYLRREFDHIGVKLPNYPTFCTLKHYTQEAHIPLKQNPNVMKPPKLTELTEHFGLSQDFIAAKCRKWYGEGGEHPHDARYDAAAAYLCMLVGEEMA
jgi:DNA polymerase III epsilon subunit-like protein